MKTQKQLTTSQALKMLAKKKAQNIKARRKAKRSHFEAAQNVLGVTYSRNPAIPSCIVCDYSSPSNI